MPVKHMTARVVALAVVLAAAVLTAALPPASNVRVTSRSLVFGVTRTDGRLDVDTLSVDGGAINVVATLPIGSSLIAVGGATALASLPRGVIAIVGLESRSVTEIHVPGAIEIGPFGAFSPDGTQVVFESKAASGAPGTQALPDIDVADLVADTVRALPVAPTSLGYTAAWTPTGIVILQQMAVIFLDPATGHPSGTLNVPNRTLYLQFSATFKRLAAATHQTHLGDDSLKTPRKLPLANTLLTLSPSKGDGTALATEAGHDLRIFDVTDGGDVLVGDAAYDQAPSKVTLSLVTFRPDGSSDRLAAPSNIGAVTSGIFVSATDAVVLKEMLRRAGSSSPARPTIEVELVRVGPNHQSLLARFDSPAPVKRIFITAV